MKNSFKVSNLIGTVYKRGNIEFTSDGSTVVCPVGNKISLYDLGNERAYTLPIESNFDFTTVAVSPNGRLLLAADAGDLNKGPELFIINLHFRNVLYRKGFKGGPIKCIKFSPDGKYFAFTLDNTVLVYNVPYCDELTFNPLRLTRKYEFPVDDTICIDWSHDSRIIAFGSEDNIVHVCGILMYKNLPNYRIRSQKDSVIGVHFSKDCYDLCIVSADGQVSIFESDFNSEKLIIMDKEKPESVSKLKDEEKVRYKMRTKLFTKKFIETKTSVVTSTAYKKESKLLVVAFEGGKFLLLDMNEDGSLIHSLSISDETISACAINKTGEWLALGVSSHGQLLVWEWESETNILKQQSHFNSMNVSAYSPDGMYIATGGEDGKLKIWSSHSSFCILTFSEHTGPITGVAFTQSGKAVLSSSLDGTVRAFDMTRYRNFKTLTAMRPAQFSCVAVDSSGELVVAGAQDVSEIFLWSLQTGRLLEMLAGHTGPVISLEFSSVPGSTTLVSTGWDKSVKVWDAINNTTAKETITMLTDGMCVTIRPDGKQLAVTTMDGQITFFNISTCTQEGNITGKNDLGAGRADADKITAKSNQKAKSFQSIRYSADGKYILAAGQSKYVCIYFIESSLLVKKFEITQNRTFDAMDEIISRRKLAENGINLALVEDRDDDENQKINVPGCKRGDMSRRAFRPEVRVTCITFSPTGRNWCACSSEGLLVYSLDDDWLFDPIALDEHLTPSNVRRKLQQEDFSLAVMMALKLNLKPLIQEVVESVPVKSIHLVCGSLVEFYVESLLSFLGSEIESTRHFGLYLEWTNYLLSCHGQNLKTRAPHLIPTLNTVQKSLSSHFNQLTKVCDHNDYMLSYILSQSELRRKRQASSSQSAKSETPLEPESDSEFLDSDDDKIMEIIK